MVREIRVYVEGGSSKKERKASLRNGLSQFLRKGVGGNRIALNVTVCGNREEAMKDFRRGISDQGDALVVLLIDSEGPVGKGESSVHYLCGKNDIIESNTAEENCHLMVQMMESWFLADGEALKDFYGRDFNANALPKNLNVEDIDTKRVSDSLNQATKKTQKGVYHKGLHAPGILEKLDPEKVQKASSRCCSLFGTLKRAVCG